MAKTVAEKRTESKPVLAVNESEIKAQLGQLVRQSVEEMTGPTFLSHVHVSLRPW